ncbi:ABC-F family ATP-binding cassette domain-containing protein [Facklamia sp. DSM 111018]|uniref:ABC-F family ATP-binding cassette domain-containing protein n=1 Tax=Facklamia lactis TaxID=2749967 RepID=A0ABS0LQX0_9LACT|nr:ABC-F family ATP-binding cassette domain-containing protein [Facklamia lactis]MBG9986549.1 ABC-F family ATP-binding cassette domain-containing protein [Facklamia lactis]
MILLQANNISRRFADYTLYENVNFSIQERDRIALVGRNGTGKSTLIKQIMGSEPINNGNFTRAKKLKIGYLEQHVAIHSNLTIWQEMLSIFKEPLLLRDRAQKAAETIAQFAQVGDTSSSEYHEAVQLYDQLQIDLENQNVYQIESDIRMVLHGFRFYEEDYDTPVQSLSGGQKTRLALAQILLKDYDLLILDEPTNHLDMETLNWLEKYLLSYKGALLIVSHDRYFLDKIANQVIEIRNHQAHLYKGNYSNYIIEKQARLEQDLKEYSKQQSEIAKLEDFIQKNIVRASTTKRAQSRRKQLEKIERITPPKQDAQAPRIQFKAEKKSGDRVIEAKNLAIGYQKDFVIADNINFDLRRQQAIAVVGPNGIGKTTLLKTILGELPTLSGNVVIGSNVSIGYYAQNVNTLDESLTILETLWQAHDNIDEWKIRSILGSFLFSGEAVEKKVSLLSGGEKARLALALLATNHDNTLLLDEPTNHLDIDSKEVLENSLIEFDGSLFFVSHDRYFINRIATQILEITPEGSQLYLGDYDYYLAKKEEEEAFNTQTEVEVPIENTETDKTFSYKENKKLKSELRKIQNLVNKAWKLTECLENEITQIHIAMTTAANNNDQEQLLALDLKLKETQKQTEEALNQWEYHSLLLEEFLEQHPHLKTSQ